MATQQRQPAEGYFCSTSEEYFPDKQALQEHYKSDFHRYNLKRKVAGLPPVTRVWFDQRKDQLGSAAGAGAKRIWLDPLTKKRFQSKSTYEAHVSSRKYQDLVKKSGQPAPQPVVSFVSKPAAGAAADKEQATVAPNTFLPPQSQADASSVAAEVDEASSQSDVTGWETASDDDEAAARSADGAEPGPGSEADSWEVWDPRRSLFDNHLSDSLEANLEYMWRRFHFSIPDSQYLQDAPGLLTYLAQKMRYGRMALYTPGDAKNAKHFASMHAVQRHMVDRGLCRMAYDDNEDEYADFYDFDKLDEDAAGDWEMVPVDEEAAPASSGYELSLPGPQGGSSKVVGNREFARYYRQRHRAADDRPGIATNSLAARYRALGVATQQPGKTPQEKQARRDERRARAKEMKVNLKANVTRPGLPRNSMW